MKEDVIRQVKDAESRAEEKTHAAHVQAESIIRDARHLVVELRQKILETARIKAKERFETEAGNFEPELEKVRQTFNDDIAKDSEQAQKKIDGVVDLVVTKFAERWESVEEVTKV